MKNNNITSHQVLIKNFSNADKNFLALFGIYKKTIDPEINYDTFLFLYHSKKLVTIDFTLFTCKDVRVGFSAAFFYAAELNNKSVFIARSATGLTDDFQGRGHHDVVDLYVKFIRFAITHPLKRLYVSAFVINPFVFSELCKFVPQFFPKPKKTVPEKIEKIINDIISGSGHPRSDSSPYSVEVPIQVRFNEKLLRRIYRSKNENVVWFLKANMGFLNKYGLLVIIEVSWKNIVGTVFNLVKYFFPLKKRAFIQRFEKSMITLQQKTVNLVQSAVKKWIL